ncbi:MAG: GTP-binding protein [Caulobacteraceae bacterium]|nr:GTP-binding protein [Caulobacteraceae bacterium]
MPKAGQRPPLPTTVLGGFLGAGKTTLVNHLLRHAGGRRIMVLVNDFGEVPIDADLIAGEANGVLSLANGCVCCSTGGDLLNALTLALDGPTRPDHLVIEASGVADPDRLADVARAEPDLTLNGIVVLVDSGRIDALASDPRLGRQVRDQLAPAHLVILNKQDRGAPPGLEARIRQLAPGAAMVSARHAAAPADLVLGELATPGGGWRARAVEAPSHEAVFARWSKVGGPPTTLDALGDRLARLPAGVVRLKGFVALGDGAMALVQATGDQREVTRLPPTAAAGPTRMFAIGLAGELEADALDALFAET